MSEYNLSSPKDITTVWDDQSKIEAVSYPKGLLKSGIPWNNQCLDITEQYCAGDPNTSSKPNCVSLNHVPHSSQLDWYRSTGRYRALGLMNSHSIMPKYSVAQSSLSSGSEVRWLCTCGLIDPLWAGSKKQHFHLRFGKWDFLQSTLRLYGYGPWDSMQCKAATTNGQN